MGGCGYKGHFVWVCCHSIWLYSSYVGYSLCVCGFIHVGMIIQVIPTIRTLAPPLSSVKNLDTPRPMRVETKNDELPDRSLSSNTCLQCTRCMVSGSGMSITLLCQEFLSNLCILFITVV